MDATGPDAGSAAPAMEVVFVPAQEKLSISPDVRIAPAADVAQSKDVFETVVDLAAALRPMVVVSVGTDHHPFDRLVQWVDRWSRARPDVDVIIQYGSAQEPGHARSVRYLSHTDLVTNIRAASVVVSHGGPATIAEAWRVGVIPLVVPRNSSLGEHVDDHQMTFVGLLASRSQVVELRSEAQLAEALDRALAEPAWLHRESGHAWDVSASLRNIEEVVRQVTCERPSRPSLFRRFSKRMSA